MDIVPDNTNKKSTSRPTMEQVEQEKEEYKLLGSFVRRRGMKLFSYDPKTDTLIEVKPKYDRTLEMGVEDNKWNIKVALSCEATVDTRNIQFEALNWKNAERKVKQYKNGTRKELCNLREFNPDGIKIY